ARLALLLPLGAVGVALIASDDAADDLLFRVLAILIVLLADVLGDRSRAGRWSCGRAEKVFDADGLIALHQFGRDIGDLARPRLRRRLLLGSFPLLLLGRRRMLRQGAAPRLRRRGDGTGRPVGTGHGPASAAAEVAHGPG